MLREHAALVLLIVLLLAYSGWTWIGRWDGHLEWCLAEYGRAHTAADTARVDHTPLTPRGRLTCRNYRVDGTLDRYREAEARRAAARP